MFKFALLACAGFPPVACKILQHAVGEHQRGTTGAISLKVEPIRSFQHDGEPFTQGLEISGDGKHLIESSGAYPAGTQSYVRAIDPATGKTLHKKSDGLGERFAEGIVQMSGGKWFLSTYQDEVMLEYDRDLNFVKYHRFPWTGWGLTRSASGSSFLATDGTEYIRELQAEEPFTQISKKAVMCRGKAVEGLNELEMVDDFLGHGPRLLGNVYLTRVVLVINPDTGHCTHVANLEGIDEPMASGESSGFHACNGLAYNKSSNTFFVTGKNWRKMFEVRLVEDAFDTDSSFSKLDMHLHKFGKQSLMQLRQVPDPTLQLLSVQHNITTEHTPNLAARPVSKGGTVAQAVRALRMVQDRAAANITAAERGHRVVRRQVR